MTQIADHDPKRAAGQSEANPPDMTVDGDSSASKRVAIGLSPRRPTAKVEPQRPPDDKMSRSQLWWLIVWIVGICIAVGLLILARVVDSPMSWTALTGNPTSSTDGSEPREYRLLIEDDFSHANPQLAQANIPNQYLVGQVASEGVYRMRIWPGNISWNILGKTCPGSFRLETSVAAAEETPNGYAGVFGRYQDGGNFYLLTIDGTGRYRVQLQKDGIWTTVKEWTPALTLNLAGTPNLLVLEDDGKTMLFSANGEPLFDIDDPELPPGKTGLVGGAQGEIAEINFHWFKLYDTPCDAP